MVEMLVDSLPDGLWRGYPPPDRVHAESFVNTGKILLHTIRYHRANEDKVRGDPDEGFARLRVPDNVTTINTETLEVSTRPGLRNLSLTEPLSPTYLFCLSTSKVSATRFGGTLVEVFNPPRFLDAFGVALHALELDLGSERYVARVDALPVRYHKDMIASASDLPERVRLTYAQKSPRFVADEEYRVAVVLSDIWEDAPEHLNLVLPDAGTFVRLLSG